MKKLFFILTLMGLLISCGSSKSQHGSKISKNSYRKSSFKKDQIRKPTASQNAQGIATKRNKSAASSKNGGEFTLENSKTGKPENAEVVRTNRESGSAQKVVDYAKSYLGSRYRYGGMSSNGIDCSGLIYLSFLNAADIDLPRRSQDLARQGREVYKNGMEIGDLVFFKTNGSRTVNHVGIVVEAGRSGVKFIHSSTSRGVMISGLEEQYWDRTYHTARRIL